MTVSVSSSVEDRSAWVKAALREYCRGGPDLLADCISLGKDIPWVPEAVAGAVKARKLWDAEQPKAEVVRLRDLIDWSEFCWATWDALQAKQISQGEADVLIKEWENGQEAWGEFVLSKTVTALVPVESGPPKVVGELDCSN